MLLPLGEVADVALIVRLVRSAAPPEIIKNKPGARKEVH
jgi:hypothetical protein